MKKATTKKTELTGFDHELDFWEGFVQSDRFKKHWATDEPNPELLDPAGATIKTEAGGRPKVLDVGCGATSILRGTIPWEDITEVDPLADDYRKIYKQCRTKNGFVEDLSSFGTFDVVHISNALDHCQNPMAGMVSLIRACKPGGLVYIQGFVNEANTHNRAGLHQWNIDTNRGRLLVGGRYSFIYVPEDLVLSEKQTLPRKNRDKIWYHFAFRKPEV